jgi:hypothetical protein
MLSQIDLGTGLDALRRSLPKELAAAMRLTLLVLIDPGHTPLDVTADALPRTLQRLQLHEYYDEDDDLIPLRAKPWNFASMDRLHSLRLGTALMAEPRLPLG